MNIETLVFNTIWQHLIISGLLVGLLVLAFKWLTVNAEIRSWVWLSSILALMVAPAFLIILNNNLDNIHNSTIPNSTTPNSTTPTLTVMSDLSPDDNLKTSIDVNSTSYFNNPIQLILNDPYLNNSQNINPNWLVNLTNFTLLIMPFIISLLIMVSLLKLICLISLCVVEYQIKLKATEKIRDNIYYSGDVYVPSLVGLINCKILLPISFKKLSQKNQEFIIAHEQAHLKRNDQLTSFVIRLIDCVIWFSPLFYVMNNQLKHVREIACDQRAIKAINKTNNQQNIESSIEIDYATMLVDSVKLFLIDKQQGGFMNLLSRKGFFKSRINEVVRENNDSHNKNLFLSTISCFILLISTCVFANNALNDNVIVQSIDDIINDENIKKDMEVINDFINLMNQDI
ncbi:M56 family metallopeptidase [Marinicellulosiphila megalodicopiae]|uniref:M56 family metallopeptidase n=1 Tax=Marinicellulosiphila megalodicopiae TaxID=2724896 RepID=UPI003BAF74CC